MKINYELFIVLFCFRNYCATENSQERSCSCPIDLFSMLQYFYILHGRPVGEGGVTVLSHLSADVLCEWALIFGGAQCASHIRRSLIIHITFHIQIFEAFWLNFMVVSFQILKLRPFFEGQCSQNNNVKIKTLHK